MTVRDGTVSDARITDLINGLNVWTKAGRSNQPELDMDLAEALTELLAHRRRSVPSEPVAWRVEFGGQIALWNVEDNARLNAERWGVTAEPLYPSPASKPEVTEAETRKLDEAKARLQEALDAFDADVDDHMANESERADLWCDMDANAEDIRTLLSALSVTP